MELDVRRLITLRAVRDAGGVLAAAAMLHVSASAVSQQISKLENDAGLQLLDRSTARRARLTIAGVRLCERADAIAAELLTARRELYELGSLQDRRVTVAGFPSAIVAILIPLVSYLGNSDPSIDLRIVEGRDDPDTVHAALRAGVIDVALVKHGGAETPDGIVETVIRDDPYVIVIPATWPDPASVRELVDVPWVGHPSVAAGPDPLARLEASEGVTLDYAHECTEYSIALAIVEAGLAAAVVPALALPSALPEGIRALEFGDLGYRRIAARHADGDVSVSVLATIDALRRVAIGQPELSTGGVSAREVSYASGSSTVTLLE